MEVSLGSRFYHGEEGRGILNEAINYVLHYGHDNLINGADTGMICYLRVSAVCLLSDQNIYAILSKQFENKNYQSHCLYTHHVLQCICIGLS